LENVAMFLTISNRNARIGLLVLCVFVLIVLIQNHAGRSNEPWSPSESYAHTPQTAQSRNSRCDAFPNPGDIAIAVKTGATEAIERIPILMLTTLQCAENVLLFSDLEQNIAGYHLQDALANVPPSAMEETQTSTSTPSCRLRRSTGKWKRC
jgi:hypothetical protein